MPPADSGAPTPEERVREADRIDAERWRAVRRLLVGADFQWGDPPQAIVAFALPRSVSISVDADRYADDVRALSAGAPEEERE